MYHEQALPLFAVTLSPRLRELRRRQGKTQSDISRRMGVDPSIPSLWEQGKRPVPPTRLAALADALGVALSELLEGIAVPSSLDLAAVPDTRMTDEAPPLTALRQDSVLGAVPLRASAAPTALPTTPVPVSWAPDAPRRAAVVDVAEGLWLDADRLERPAARNVLRDRLCAADRETIGALSGELAGAALADRISRHCSRLDDWHKPVPVAEALFRAVLSADGGGLPVSALVASLAGRVPPDLAIGAELIRRLGPSLRRAYPVRWMARSAPPLA